MNVKKKLSRLFAQFALVFCCMNIVEAAASSLSTVSTAETGVWINSFRVATNFAFSAGKPLVMIWSNDICDHCSNLKKSLGDPEFTSWQKKQPYVFCHVEGVSGSDTSTNRGAKEFAVAAGGYGKKITGGYPLVSLLWLEGGNVRSVATFSGRPGKMGVVRKTQMYMELMEAIEIAFADYGRSELGFFPVSNTAFDRFEAEPTTEVVRIPIDRVVSDEVSTNVLEIFKGGALAMSSNVVWKAGESRTMVGISLGDIGGLSYDGSEVLSMRLSSPADGMSTNGSIHLVAAQPNSVVNPYFAGERDIASLDWADWTLDWDLVMEKVAKANTEGRQSYALAVFSGTLWCPYCKGIENSLFSSEKFRAWLRDNNVQLALFDQALSATDSYAGKGHLLTYSAGLDHFVGVTHQMTSGAAYLTRHGLAEDDETVQSVVARTQRQTVGWRAPESTSARLSNPTILLIDSNGQVRGRLNAWRDRNKALGGDERYYDPDENIARLDALLELAERGECDDYASTTTLEHQTGFSSSAVLQVNSAKRFWNLTKVAPGTLSFRRTDASANPVVFTLCTNGVSVASGMNGLEVKITSRLMSSNGLQVGVSSGVFSGSDNPFVSKMKECGSFAVEFSSSLVPATVADSLAVPMSFATSMVLEELDVEEGQSISVKLSSGRLPSGLKIKYDKQTKSIVLSGTPSKAANETVFSYVVTVREGKTKVNLDPVEVSITVFDPSGSNPYLGTARKTTVPLVAFNGTLAGGLEVSMTAKNRVTVKYAGVSKKSLSFSGSWSEISDDGTVSASMAKNGVSLGLTMDANGILHAALDGITSAYSDFVTEGSVRLEGSSRLGVDFSSFSGYYTAILPSGMEGVTGTGYMTLTFTSQSAVKSGLVKYSALMPNGQTLSGNRYLSIDMNDPDYALLPIVKRTSSVVFTALLRIQANGAQLYADSATARIVMADPGVVPYWSVSEKGLVRSGPIDVYGGWYLQGTSVPEWMEMFEEYPSQFNFSFVVPELNIESETYGPLAEMPSFTLVSDSKKGFVFAEKPAGFSISFNARTGIFSGRGKIVFKSGKSISATYKGILTPGWLDCGCGDALVTLPFGSGTLYYQDRVDGRSVRQSVGVEIQ